MLVIRRRPGESLLIGDDVEVRVVDVGAGRVTIGIVAPRSVAILRKEVQLTREQNRAAAGGAPAESVWALVKRLNQ